MLVDDNAHCLVLVHSARWQQFVQRKMALVNLTFEQYKWILAGLTIALSCRLLGNCV
jgi:hypothetical protein